MLGVTADAVARMGASLDRFTFSRISPNSDQDTITTRCTSVTIADQAQDVAAKLVEVTRFQVGYGVHCQGDGEIRGWFELRPRCVTSCVTRPGVGARVAIMNLDVDGTAALS